MEVHHHPHVEKKNFKEYFLEFVMIFLAVTLGFFAENIREHFTDSDKEKRNIESIIKSVAIDTAYLKKVIQLNQNQIKGIDSLISIKNEDVQLDTVKWKYYYYILNFLDQKYYFHAKNAGIEQLKSSGGLSLIKNQAVTDNIQAYDIFTDAIYEQQADCEYMLTHALDIEFKLLDFAAIKSSPVNWASYPAYNADAAKLLPSINNDALLLKQFFGYAAFASVSNNGYVSVLENQLQRGRNLISFLKKEYRIKD